MKIGAGKIAVAVDAVEVEISSRDRIEQVMRRWSGDFQTPHFHRLVADTLEPALFEELGTTIASAEVTESEMLPLEVADPHGAQAFGPALFQGVFDSGDGFLLVIAQAQVGKALTAQRLGAVHRSSFDAVRRRGSRLVYPTNE